MNLIRPKTALISLSDKTNLEELISFLLSQNVKMISTGGHTKPLRRLQMRSLKSLILRVLKR